MFESHSFIVLGFMINRNRFLMRLSHTIKNKKMIAMSEIIDPMEEIMFQKKKVSG